jgi:hypothetical protein
LSNDLEIRGMKIEEDQHQVQQNQTQDNASDPWWNRRNGTMVYPLFQRKRL